MTEIMLAQESVENTWFCEKANIKDHDTTMMRWPKTSQSNCEKKQTLVHAIEKLRYKKDKSTELKLISKTKNEPNCAI